VNITRDVVIDLLPVYESGDASADTRAIVDEFVRSDAEFARIVKAARAPARPRAAVVSPEAHVERAAVSRTRQALKRQSWTLGLAIFFTLVPFSFADFTWQGREVDFFMWRDEPGSRLFLLSAVYLWWSYWRQTRAMKTAGW
jgi:hypothetical protein